MNTQTRTRPADYQNTPRICLFGLDWIGVPMNCRIGSFTKAVTKAHALPSEAVADLLARGPIPAGDLLLTANHDGRWQIRQRTEVIGRLWSSAGQDSYAKKAPFGPGRLFIR